MGASASSVTDGIARAAEGVRDAVKSAIPSSSSISTDDGAKSTFGTPSEDSGKTMTGGRRRKKTRRHHKRR